MNIIHEHITEALRSHGVIEHIAPGFVEPHARSFKSPAVARTYSLSQMLPKAPVSAQEAAVYAGRIDARESVGHISMKADIMAQSRVAQAGAQLIVVSPEARVVPGSNGEVLYALEGSLRKVNPAKFAQVNDGADVATTGYPVVMGRYKMSDAPSSAVRFEVTRRAQKFIDGDLLAYELMHSLSLGLAREMDRILLSEIASQPNQAFSLGAAAAKNLQFSDLRGFVGTTGTGANVNAAGNLVANGVPAELTDTTAGTIIGAFATAGVAVMDDIQVVIERADKSGKLSVTVYLNAVPVLADRTLFWTAA